MKKSHIRLISALLFLTYGLLSHKIIFTSLGAVFTLIAIAEHLKSKK